MLTNVFLVQNAEDGLSGASLRCTQVVIIEIEIEVKATDFPGHVHCSSCRNNSSKPMLLPRNVKDVLLKTKAIENLMYRYEALLENVTSIL